MKLNKEYPTLQYDPILKLNKKEDVEFINFIYSDKYTNKEPLTIFIDEGNTNV